MLLYFGNLTPYGVDSFQHIVEPVRSIEFNIFFHVFHHPLKNMQGNHQPSIGGRGVNNFPWFSFNPRCFNFFNQVNSYPITTQKKPAVMDSRNRKSGGDYYAQLVGQIFNEPAKHARRISRDFSDPIARLTIRALLDVLPGLRNDSLPFAYLFAVAAMISSIANTGRVEGLSGGECDSKDVDRIMSLLIPFISGGLRAVEAAEIGRREATNPKDAEET